MMRHRSAVRTWSWLAVFCSLSAAPAHAQGCDTLSSETSLARLSGRAIGSIRIQTSDPEPMPVLPDLLSLVHVQTREATVRRELLFSVGDTIDTTMVAESMRRLRRLRYLADARIVGTSCGGPVTLAVVTHDAWSLRPGVQVRSSSAAFELAERNLLGTGRRAELSLRSDRGRLGVGATLDDPAVLGNRAMVSIGIRRYSDGDAWNATVSRREQRIDDPWGIELWAGQSRNSPLQSGDAAASRSFVSGELFHRGRAGLLATHLLGISDDARTWLQMGVEGERAGLVSALDVPRIGPSSVRREFAALNIGVRRRSMAFDTLTWLLPADALVDVPLSLEADVLVGVGREFIGHGPVVHLDAWMGKAWRPSTTSLISSDLWVSGYRAARRWNAGTLRGNIGYERAARRGTWQTRLGAEWLFDPDPDLGALVTADPTAGALPDAARLAEGAIALSVERDVRLRPLSRSWALDAAAFTALSTRWDALMPACESSGCTRFTHRTDEGTLERIDAGIVGFGLRLAPTRAGRATARLDVGFPVLHSPGVRRQPFLAISITPWFENARHRDGRDTP